MTQVGVKMVVCDVNNGKLIIDCGVFTEAVADKGYQPIQKLRRNTKSRQLILCCLLIMVFR